MAGTDRELLEKFIAGGSDPAFAELVRRHGGMVMGVCERTTGDSHDGEDAFQATFLALARSAAKLRRRESLASWLHRVALRVSLDAKRRAANRRRHERRVAEVIEKQPENVWRELGDMLDEELDRMPERLRAPVVLCCIENKTTEEAARQLGWTHGALRARLAKAKDLLRSRLKRRGVVVGAAVLAAVISEKALAAIPGEACVASTIAAASAFASAGRAPAGAVSSEVASLALRVTRTAARVRALTAGGAAAVAASVLLAVAVALKGPRPPVSPAPHAEPEEAGVPVPVHGGRPEPVETEDVDTPPREAEAAGSDLPEAVRRALFQPEEARYPGAVVESVEKVTTKGVRPAVTVRLPLAGKWRAKRTKKLVSSDPRISALARELVGRDVDDSAWPQYEAPGNWERYGGEWADMNGEAVFRKTVEIPEEWAGEDLVLSLGAIDDFDDTFFNGRRVGGTDSRTPDFWQAPRRYRVPAGLVKPGRSVITVRAFDLVAEGGFRGRAKEMFLEPAHAPAEAEAATHISLAGKWRARQTRKVGSSADTGITALATELVASDVDDSAWPGYEAPGNWERYGGEWADMNGEAVFRRTVEIPEEWAGEDVVLSLGAIDDFDDTFFNGEKVGRTDGETPEAWWAPRRYKVAARLVRPGRNVVAVRVFDRAGGGGFGGTPKEMFLTLAAAERAAAKTAGPWPVSVVFTEPARELVAYRVRLEVDGRDCELELTPAGELLRATEEIAAADLPKGVVRKIRRLSPAPVTGGAPRNVTEAFVRAITGSRRAVVIKRARRKTEGGVVFYEVALAIGGTQRELALVASGQPDEFVRIIGLDLRNVEEDVF